MHQPQSHQSPRSSQPPPPSLDPQESNVDPEHTRGQLQRTSEQRPEVIFRHSGWSRQRSMIFDALCDTGAGETRKLRYANCGEGCWCFKTVTQPRRFKLAANYCHDRFCKPCCTARGQTVAANINDYTKGRRLRFLTLTLQQRNEPLEVILNHLVKSFRRLRTSKQWQRHVTGGIAFIEIKYQPHSNQWHVHLHSLIEGRYWPQSAISAAWRTASKGSYIVDIRPVTDPKRCTAYVVKYATKAIDAQTIYNPRALRMAIAVLRGRRVMTTFGNWRGLSATKPIDDGDWVPVAPLRDLIRDADRGDVLAQWILGKLRRDVPWTKKLNDRAPPPDPYGGNPQSNSQIFRRVPVAE